MDLLAWVASIGGFLLLMSLASAWIRHLPVTTFILYLAAGIIAGPWVLKLLHIDLAAHALGMARVTEAALVISLFMTGLRLRTGFHDPGWRTALRLALPAMALTVAGICVTVHCLFALPWPMAFLIGAIIAPTDPVLASMVAVGNASDHDSLRIALSGEAGLNDGTALPFVVLALLFLDGPISGAEAWTWLARDFGWSLVAGLGIGFGLGWIVGWLGMRLRVTNRDVAPSDFLALALIAVSYAAAISLSASGFLAAFAAGLGLRHVELYVVRHHPHPQVDDEDRGPSHPPAEVLVNPNSRQAEDATEPAASMGIVVSDALSFGDTLERLIAAALVLLLGVAFASYWHAAGLLVALMVFVVVRPAAVWLTTIGTRIPPPRRLLIGWLGIRGVGSLNYLAYAATHGLNTTQTNQVAGIVITVVALSIVVHGITTPSLMAWRQARLRDRATLGDATGSATSASHE